MSEAVKECFKCGESKPLSSFYVHKRMGDGHLNKCKQCTRADVNLHRAKNIDRIRQYDRDRASQPHRKAARVVIFTEWARRNPNGVKAHSKVLYAVRSGKLAKWPCEVCGEEKSEAHHPHYDAPLLVTWLCRSHHMQIHTQQG